jgi:hypothetical protein
MRLLISLHELDPNRFSEFYNFCPLLWRCYKVQLPTLKRS